MSGQFVGLIFLILVPFVICRGIHNLFIENEIFQADRIAASDYEVVQLWHTLKKRDTSGEIILKGKNEERKLHLQRSDRSLAGEKTPVWLAEATESGVYYNKLDNDILKDAVQLYFDPKEQAVIALMYGNEALSMFGTINGRSFYSLPSSFTGDVMRERRDIFPDSQSLPDSADRKKNYTDAGHHIILNEPSIAEDSPSLGFIHSKNVVSFCGLVVANMGNVSTLSGYSQFNESERNIFESDSKLPNVIKPELLITMDYALNIDSPKDPRLLRFLLNTFAYWNVVDLRFRELEKPKVRLQINGIIVATSRAAVPYMTKNTIKGIVNVRNAAEGMLKHLLFSTVVPSITHDILVTQTDRPLCTPDLLRPSSCDISSEGYAVSRYKIKCSDTVPYGMKTVIFKESGVLRGINRAVHEIGYALGAVHDGDSRDTDCNESESFIMPKSEVNIKNNLIWSKCSQRIISAMITRKLDCKINSGNKNNQGGPLSPILPGDLTTLRDVCKSRGWELACEGYDGNCEALRCKNTGILSGLSTGWSCTATEPPPEGSACDRGKYCFNGKCVNRHEESEDDSSSDTR